MRLFKKILVGLLLVLPLYSADWYADSEGGNDSNDGSTPALAKQSLSFMSSISDYDNVYFKRGSKWYDFSETYTSLNNSNWSDYGPDSLLIPTISSGVLCTSPSVSGNRYTFTNPSIPGPSGDRRMVGSVKKGEVFYQASRWPDTGFNTTSGGNSTSLTDVSQSWTTNEWVGATIAVAINEWEWYYAIITSNTSNTLYFSSIGANVGSGKRYIIRNGTSTTALTMDGEFASRSGSIIIYSSTTIDSIEVAANDYSLVFSGNSDDINIDNVRFQCSNLQLIRIPSNEMNISFDSVSLEGCGGFALYYYDGAEGSTNNSLFSFRRGRILYAGSGGLYLSAIGDIYVVNNLYYRNAALDGYENKSSSLDFNGASVFSRYGETDNQVVSTNLFIENRIATQSQFSREIDFSNNLIIRGGYYNEIKDFASGHYNVNESRGSSRKEVSNYMLIDCGNPNSPLTGVTKRPNGYSDEGSINIHYDGWHVRNTNTAIYFNYGSDRSMKGWTITGPGQAVTNTDWTNIVFSDSVLASNPGSLGYPLEDDTITDNFMVIPDIEAMRYLTHHNLSGAFPSGFDIDRNHIMSPFNRTTDDVVMIRVNYGSFTNYTLPEWQAFSPYDDNSTYDETTWDYSSVSSSVSQETFIFHPFNYSESSHSFPLGDLTVKDRDGVNHTGSVTIPAFSSNVYTYVSGADTNLIKGDNELYLDTTLFPLYNLDGVESPGPGPEPEPDEDTCFYRYLIGEPITSAETARFRFENNFNNDSNSVTMSGTNHAFSTSRIPPDGSYMLDLNAGAGNSYTARVNTSSVNLGDNFEIEFDFLRDAINSWAVLGYGDGFDIIYDNRDFVFRTGTDSAYTSGDIYTIGSWSKLTFDISNSNCTIYVDDVDVTSSYGISSSFDKDGEIHFGRDRTLSTYSYFYMDDLNLRYGSALGGYDTICVKHRGRLVAHSGDNKIISKGGSSYYVGEFKEGYVPLVFPEVDAGENHTIASDSTITLAPTVSNYDSVRWFGEGTFSNRTILTPTYTPTSTGIFNIILRAYNSVGNSGDYFIITSE